MSEERPRPLAMADFAGFRFERRVAGEDGPHARKRLVAVVCPAAGSLVLYRVESCDAMAFESPSLPVAIERYNELQGSER